VPVPPSAVTPPPTVVSGWLPAAIDPAPPDLDPYGAKIITLRNGRTIRTAFNVDSFITALPRSSGIPFLVLRGAPCWGGCGAAPGLVIIRADTGALDSIPRFAPYPGVVRIVGDEDSSPAVFRSRLFIGECLDSMDGGLVWFKSTPDSANTWVPSLLRVTVRADTLEWVDTDAPIADVRVIREHWREMRAARPDVRVALRRVRLGNCREVPGREQVDN
jgi:hypothetical protein